MTRKELDAVEEAIEAGPIEVSEAQLEAGEAAVREIRMDPASAVEVRVEREVGRVEELHVYVPNEADKEELRSFVATLFEKSVEEGGAVVVRKEKVAELERELRDKGLVRIEFVVTDRDPVERVAVWVMERSPLWFTLASVIARVLSGSLEPKSREPKSREPEKGTKAPPESDEPMEPKGTKSGESDEPHEPMKAPMSEPVEKDKEPQETKSGEPTAPEPEKETAAAKAVRLREVARRAAEAAREAEEEAEAAEADRREAERASTKEELESAMEELRCKEANVERLRELLARQKEKERQARKRKRSSADESEPRKEGRRVAARHEREEIVMVKDGEFKAVMGPYEGAVHDAVVERFEAKGPGGIGPASGGESVRERVYGTGNALFGEFPVGTRWDGGEVVVVKGFRDVMKFDGVMELGGFVRVVIDVDGRCVNPMSPAEPEWCTDTERVWVKRGSVEHAGLEALIAKGCQSQWRPEWHCPPSPVYRPVGPGYVPASPVGPEDDEEMSVVD